MGRVKEIALHDLTLAQQELAKAKDFLRLGISGSADKVKIADEEIHSADRFAKILGIKNIESIPANMSGMPPESWQRYFDEVIRGNYLKPREVRKIARQFNLKISTEK